MLEAVRVKAALGPTNTGKTHRAIERMLSYDSGMIGLPLRLLAREVYDKVSMAVGEERVALVTGEERRVPRRPDYWVCTVESMPVGREVDFVAVDEIQLASHAQRGHVFTARLLHARGRRETWLLGADTMRGAVQALLPTAQLEPQERLSRLTFAGAERLTRLPPRSAVVAFSAGQVYAIAERIKRAKGGAAVVFGALSPRTRNAQVAMYQAGEVDTLVATDAIGMGLNLSISHVAFAALHKYDGRGLRGLDPAELAQIAGRAGRYRDDGTFGTLSPLELSPDLAAELEQHRLEPVRTLVWRSVDLDFSSTDALLRTLTQRPRSPWLRLVDDAEDTASLEALSRDDAVRPKARTEAGVRLLWEVCTIPDFRDFSFESHVHLLGEVHAQLSSRAERLERDWLEARFKKLDDPSGDIAALLDRIAEVRTFSYISHRDGWCDDARGWQERARSVEDRLSDALHLRLVERFVDRGTGRKSSSQKKAKKVVDPAHPFAQLAKLKAPDDEAPSFEQDQSFWVELLTQAPTETFSLDARGRLFYEETQVGQLIAGKSLLLPEVKLADLEGLGAGARSRILRRLSAFVRDAVEALLSPLFAPGREASAALSEAIYQLRSSLGTILPQRFAPALAALDRDERELLRRRGVVLGQRVVYVDLLHTQPAIERRFALVEAYVGRGRVPACTPHHARSLPLSPGVDRATYTLLGYPVFGPRAVRADVAEGVFQALGEVRGGGDEALAQVAQVLGCDEGEVPWVLDELDG